LDFKFNEIARLTRLKDKVLRRFTEGDLDRRPRLEAEGRRFSRNLERITGSIAFVALVNAG
jgi:hypothetical protein